MRGEAEQENELFAHLPRQEQECLRSRSEFVTVETREELNGVAKPVRHLYFPLTAAISLLYMDRSGRAVEAAVVGSEGCASPYVIEGVKDSPCRTLVQVGGSAYRLDVSDLWSVLSEVPMFERMVRRFNGVIFRHAILSLGCSQFHSVNQRIGRWLLAHHHRTGLTRLPFTHDFLAEQLGVQRVTVTNALAAFEKQKIVTYGYGQVELRNLFALKNAACECFLLAKQAIEEYLTDIKSYRHS
jgi:DNA-binding transcriptional regulator YhcF (GntR family)